MPHRRVIHYREDLSKVWAECGCGWIGTKYFKKYGRGKALENAGKNWSKHECMNSENEMGNTGGNE